ncbi:outer membrane lipoprotein carrier protein LolA [Halomonas sp. McH1-25]|uniref:outer membrane lipoprotein carrier protein LolA n=1 Tax=unclassified Halomonas TaxID=2609666 RepID=UPI001EF50164|nr:MULTISPECIES: outer membrane lipoprotein carrier protein LolA [unclassified Halomonas]MCG7600172.1 outer membrane lipoprotein carrier protein LolA [Halomonas sp. McH1-25]MCP1341421.1 outer membrane lipoprotein carrier protein LolA [Halomonas sp. FL8]MCP1363501.1 outer membrane lipoprotein carrier protein LolA [Halomonas sp. BBD45]
MIRPLLLLLLWLPGSALAFTLGDLQARLNQTDALAGRFEQQRHLADLDTQLTSRGHFRYRRDERIVWVLESPIQDRLEFTPDSAANIDDALGGDRRGRDQVATLLLDLLGGDWQALEERFHLELSGDAQGWQVNLVPKSAALRDRLSRIRLEGGHYLNELTLHAANGDRLHVRFFDQHPPAEGVDASP